MQKIDPTTRARIALAAGVHDRTVDRYLRGLRRPIPAVREAIDRALRKFGFEPPAAAEAGQP